MIMSENIDIFKSDTKPPKVMIKELPSSDRHDDFGRDVIRASQTSALDAEKNGNNDLIETDDELLEVGSNEGPDGSEEEDDDDEDDEGDNSNLSRPLDFTTGRKLSDSDDEGQDYVRPFKRIADDRDRDGRGVSQIGPNNSSHTTKKKGVRSFCIDDILSHKTAELQRSKPEQPGIVRPWDQARGQEQEQGVGRQGSRRKSAGDSPLDALFNMASNFEAMKAKSDMERAQMSFANKQPPKKKRKSRTAFTNHQIFELEKRFLYQKYLSPADRDEIAASLGLSNAQVICWFQNRRAKFKRDMEELKKDVEKTSQVGPGPGPGPGVSVASVVRPPPHLPIPTSVSFHPPGLGHHPGLPHPLILHSLAPHLLPASLAASPCRSPIGSPCGSSPPIRVEDSD